MVVGMTALEVLELVRDLASQEWQEPDGSRKCAVDNRGRRLWFLSEDLMAEVRSAIAAAEHGSPVRSPYLDQEHQS